MAEASAAEVAKVAEVALQPDGTSHCECALIEAESGQK